MSPSLSLLLSLLLLLLSLLGEIEAAEGDMAWSLRHAYVRYMCVMYSDEGFCWLQPVVRT